MNRFQKVVLYGVVLNVMVLFVFPPHDAPGFGRAAPMFDAFYPIFSAPASRTINGDLLYILLTAVLANAALAWLLLTASRATPGEPRFSAQMLVIVFGVFNLAVAFLFPPMESFPFAQRVTVGTFDGFYFAFGDKSRRAIFVPLLFMEVLFILINAFSYWLAMSIAARNGPPESGPLTMLAQADDLRQRAESRLLGEAAAATSVSKRGPERRVAHSPGYKGPEKRKKGERRRKGSR